MNTFIITSSCGTIVASVSDGVVVTIDTSNDPQPDKEFKSIQKMDIEEYKKYYGKPIKKGDSVDILDIGYWHKRKFNGEQNEYEPACKDWRDEVKLLRKKAKA